MGRFERAVRVVLAEEGVLADEPTDPGGETWYGIARAKHPNVSPWPPSRESAISIYRTEYWDKFHCDEMPMPLDLILFDAVVQHGGLGLRMLQRAVGVSEDGVMGPITKTAIKRHVDAPGLGMYHLVAMFMAYRVVFIYQPSQNWSVFGKGWMIRLFRVTLASAPDALAMLLMEYLQQMERDFGIDEKT